MRIVIFGANGQTGRLLTQRVLDAGHSAVAVTRRPDDFPIADPGLTVVGADVRNASSLVGVTNGADAVTGVQRLVVVSSTGAFSYPGRRDTPTALRIFEPIVTRTIGKSTYDDQRRMESIVRDSGLDWTIVRPSGLFDLPHVTKYVAGAQDPVGAFTSRNDLADYLFALAVTAANHDVVTISTTADTPTMWQMIRREAFKSA